MNRWSYVRDAAFVLVSRNECYRELHSALMPYRFAFGIGGLEHLIDLLRNGPARECLDSLPLSRDPAFAAILDLEGAIEAVIARDDDVMRGRFTRTLEMCVAALETACMQTTLPRELCTAEIEAGR